MIKALSLARNLIRLNFCLRKRYCDTCRFHYAYRSCEINVDSADSVIINKTINKLIDNHCMYCSDILDKCPMYRETGGYCTINNYMKYVKTSKNMGCGVL